MTISVNFHANSSVDPDPLDTTVDSRESTTWLSVKYRTQQEVTFFLNADQAEQLRDAAQTLMETLWEQEAGQ